MPINEKLANRVREMLADANLPMEEKKMFSGLCFMVDDKMCICVSGDYMMVRLDRAVAEKVLEEKDGCELMTMGGKVMKGFVRVDEEVLHTNRELLYWVKMGLEFNKVAKSSKKK